MKEIIFSSYASKQERTDEIVKFLKMNRTATVNFRKKNGELRIMNCTIDATQMPSSESHKVNVTDNLTESIPVWDLDKSAWRSFKPANVVAIRS